MQSSEPTNVQPADDGLEAIARLWIDNKTGEADNKDWLAMVCAAFARQQMAEERKRFTKARPESEWHEDMGPVLWWNFPIAEPPYAGTPLDCDFPEYKTHWTPIPIPENPAAIRKLEVASE